MILGLILGAAIAVVFWSITDDIMYLQRSVWDTQDQIRELRKELERKNDKG